MAPTPIERLKRANRKLTALQVLLDDEEIPSMPEWVQLQTTDFCNLQCPHCNTHGTEEKRAIFNHTPNMDPELFSVVAANALPAADEVTLTVTGEPLATKRLPEVIEEITPYGARLNLVTNGTTLNAQRMSRVLPASGWIKLSIDGATPRVLETLRKGARWADLLTRLRALLLAREAMPEGLPRPGIAFAVVAMASNMADLPHLVRLAALLGVEIVSVGPIIVVFDDQKEEALDRHPAAWNHWHRETMQVARKLGVDCRLPPPFPNAKPDAKATPTEGLIVDFEGLDLSQEPDFSAGIDEERAAKMAQETVRLIEERLAAGLIAPDDATAARIAHMADQAEAVVKSTIETHAERLAEVMDAPDEEVRWCEFSSRRTYVDQAGRMAPCCTPGRPVLGQLDREQGIFEVWNAPEYRKFRREVREETPPDCCVGCWHWRKIPRSRLIGRIDENLEEFAGLTPWIKGQGGADV